jgi:rhodanese-related sulfurtransferase
MVELEGGAQVPALKLGPAEGGDLVLARVHTPGHTDDSYSLLLGRSAGGKMKRADVRFAFCGDTILSGGLGRTNFSMSDPKALFDSLRKLHAVLDARSLLCPAHDYTDSFTTSLEAEKRENALLALAVGSGDPDASLKQFLAKKGEIDLELKRLEETFQGTVCGVTPSGALTCAADAQATIAREEFSRIVAGPNPPLIIDVREPQEFSLCTDWEGLGLGSKQVPENVPLSRWVNFSGELAATSDPDREVILICRSGRRSLQAAKSLRRLGIARAWSLEGGMALT